MFRPQEVGRGLKIEPSSVLLLVELLGEEIERLSS
jgi:hypothetical protein